MGFCGCSRERVNTYFSSAVVPVLAVVLLSSCANQTDRTAIDGVASVADLQVVDCLLPGQVRRLGSGVYQTPRRPALTTASDCRIRGGEYVEYDRADYKTALTVWMPSAEQGDADAQTNVGEIFERGLGGEPNYAAAIIWYERAAEQGNSRALFNLGTLYEQGLGVEKNQLKAINLYRQAWDLPVDTLIYQSAANAAQEELREQLQQSVREKDAQIRLLNREIESLQEGANNQRSGQQANNEELEALKSLVVNLNREREDAGDELLRLRQPLVQEAVVPEVSIRDAKAIVVKDMDFGKYYALIIGNQNYDIIDDLETPRGDAQRAKQILQDQYGFRVTMLLDADNTSVMQAINEMNEVVTENDNLLIFYAGHGSRISLGDYVTGYWLPTNASAPPNDTYWVSNEFITRHLARNKAKRVMVVADSCYAGLLSEEPGYLLMGDQPNYSEDYVRYKMAKKSRLLLSSGGDQPVLDGGGQGNSVFARAFLDALESADVITSGPELFVKVRDSVTKNASAAGFAQTPEFKVIKGAGHEVGDFFFVRQ